MYDKFGIIIKDKKAPTVSSNEIKSILAYFNTKSLDTIVCENIIEAKSVIKEKYEEISFIYLTNPIPTLEENIQDFIEFINKNEHYRHIEFFARMPKKQKESKYIWDDDFISYIKF
ncbi:MAG: hypothetical protein ACFFE5_00890 [Candidatus Thorarchaeota archaeon]